jgi:hypothetical protein
MASLSGVAASTNVRVAAGVSLGSGAVSVAGIVDPGACVAAAVSAAGIGDPSTWVDVAGEPGAAVSLAGSVAQPASARAIQAHRTANIRRFVILFIRLRTFEGGERFRARGIMVPFSVV